MAKADESPTERGCLYQGDAACTEIYKAKARLASGVGRARIVRACDGLGPNALTILAEIAERLQRGAEQYKNDLDDGRNWRNEAHEEALDYLVYMTRAHVEERQRRAADAQRQAAALRLDDETLRLRDHSRLDPRDGEAPAAQRWSPTESRYVVAEPPDGSGCG